MNADGKSLLDRYTSMLQSYVVDLKETDLQEAYELGRVALAKSSGLLEIAAIHHAALTYCLMDVTATRDRTRILRAAERFFVESIMPFEMSLRGFEEANAALKTSEEKYRELFENASDIVFTADLEGNFTSFNKATEKATGYSSEESGKVNFSHVVAPEYQEAARRMLDLKLTGEESTTYTLEILTKQGVRVPMEVSTRLIYRNGKPVGAQGIARDISERKRAEEALLHLNDALEEQAKRIAHELHDESGQLLASVHIALEEVARNLASPEKKALENVKGLLDQIEAQLRRLSHELRPTILDDLGLPAAIEFLAQGVSQRSHLPITVVADTEGRLPAQVEIVLYRIIQEGLNNISRHAEAKDVRVSVWREGKTIHCSVSDDGIGFDMKTANARHGRSGLGLIGMRERLAAVGGTFIIKSSPGQGTNMFVTIPMESEDASSSHSG